MGHCSLPVSRSMRVMSVLKRVQTKKVFASGPRTGARALWPAGRVARVLPEPVPSTRTLLCGAAQVTYRRAPSAESPRPEGVCGTAICLVMAPLATSKTATSFAVAQAMERREPSGVAARAAGEREPGCGREAARAACGANQARQEARTARREM